jgi:hypothetical protein
MNVTRVTHYIEAISQWTGIALIVTAFVKLPVMTAGIIAVCIVVLHLLFISLLSKFDDRYLGKLQAVQDKVEKADNQIREYCKNWISKDQLHLTKEQVQRDRELLMLDWLDVNPGETRVDFQKYFDHRLECAINCVVYSYPEELVAPSKSA